MHCGFCLQACPTYVNLEDENDSPRGRLVLMRRLLDGEIPISDPDASLHLDRCLGCRACETACPSGVPYGELLEGHPAHRHGVTFLQVAPESRCDVPEYQRLGQQVQRQVGRINGRHGDEAWTPLRYVNRSYPHEDLAGFYRLARVGLVTPLRDGMNLVAKEFVACQDGTDPGVLVLSRYAGAARELDSALQVDPADTRGCAEAIACALSMPREERRERWRAAMARLREATIHGWGERFVAALEGSAGTPLALPSRLVRLSRRQQKERERVARAVADAGPLADQASA